MNLWTNIAVGLLLAGCGSSGLKYQVDNKHFVELTPQELTGVSSARTQADAAKSEVESAKANLDKTHKDLQAAEGELHRAELAHQLATAKINWQKARKTLGEKQVRIAEKKEVYERSRVETEKVKVANARHIQLGKDQTQSTFEAQEARLQKDYAEARVDMEKSQLQERAASQKYEDANHRYAEATK